MGIVETAGGVSVQLEERTPTIECHGGWKDVGSPGDGTREGN